MKKKKKEEVRAMADGEGIFQWIQKLF